MGLLKKICPLCAGNSPSSYAPGEGYDVSALNCMVRQREACVVLCLCVSASRHNSDNLMTAGVSHAADTCHVM